MPHFFFCDYTFSYSWKTTGICLHIYSLPSSAFLKYQTSGFFIVPEANLVPLLTFERVHFASFTFIIVFSAKYWTGHRFFIHKLELYCALTSKKKKKSISDWHLFTTQMETKWTKWYTMTSHEIAYRSLCYCFSVCTHFILIAFLRILTAYLRKYAAYLGC